jgi:hypothetical protein
VQVDREEEGSTGKKVATAVGHIPSVPHRDT